MRAIKNQTGAAIARCSTIKVTLSNRRVMRMFLRIGQQQTPKIPAAYASRGVLEFEHIVITVQPTMPAAADALARPFFHSRKNKGNRVAPKVPAIIEC